MKKSNIERAYVSNVKPQPSSGLSYAPSKFMAGQSHRTPEPAPGADWEALFRQMVAFATQQTAKLRWRGSLGGVLPDGHDARSIAAEALAQLATEARDQPPSSGSNRELRKLIRKHLDRLHHRKETFVTRNDPDLTQIAKLQSAEPNPADTLMNAEAEAEREEFKRGFTISLNGERALSQLFDCFCAGVFKRRSVAAKLGLSPRAVTNLKKRLQRKLNDYRRQREEQNIESQAPDKKAFSTSE